MLPLLKPLQRMLPLLLLMLSNMAATMGFPSSCEGAPPNLREKRLEAAVVGAAAGQYASREEEHRPEGQSEHQ
eukprot:9955935-Prorocentrum_lima.AAC.1